MFSTKEPNPQCHHTDKYEISTDGEPVPELPYPSRLGFLHTTELGPTIRYVELNKKLCRGCCDSLVCDGNYLVWSVLAGTSAAKVTATLAALLPGDGHFPPILQAGSESNASHNVVLPIPDIPGAREAWRWLESQSKPFYIDQLHMVVGRNMSPLARKRAAKDSTVALRYGQVFSLNLSRSPPATSTAQPAQLDQTTQDTADSASSVKKKTTSKKDSAKKDSAKKDSTKKDSTKKDSIKGDSTKKGSTKKDSEETKSKEKKSKEKKSEEEKSGEKKSEGKSKKEKKEKKSTQATDVNISSAKHSTEGCAPKSSTALLPPTDGDSKVNEGPTKTPSTNSLVASEITLKASSTTNLVTELTSLKSKLGGTPSASASINDQKGPSSEVNSLPVITTTVKTYSRSWGWSEPFEFTTGPRRVPALSDYERVAESRAPSQSTANSIDNFLQEHLQLDAHRKLHGPVNTKSVPHKAGAAAASSLPRESTALLLSESKASKSKSRDRDPSTKKKTKDQDDTCSPRKPNRDSRHSGSSDVPKPAKSHQTTKKENIEKSTERKRVDQLNLANSDKSSRDKNSEKSKQQVHKDASSTSSNRVDKKAADLSTHRNTSVHRAKEVHDTSIKVKRSPDQAGSFTGVLKAGSNYLQHKLNEATEKTPKENKHQKESKHQKEKPSKPVAKPHGYAHHEKNDHSDDGELKPSAHTGSKPPQSSQSEDNGPSQPSNVPSQADLPDQNSPQVQADPSTQTEAQVSIGSSGSTQPAQSDIPVQGGAQGHSESDTTTQVPAQEGDPLIPYQPVGVSTDPTGSSETVLGQTPIQDGTGQQDAGSSNQGATSSSIPSNALGIVSPETRTMDVPGTSGDNQHASAGNVATGHKPLDSTTTNQPIPGKYQADYSPVKSTKMGRSSGVGVYDHAMAQEPKRTRSKKLGSHIAHDKPAKSSETRQSKSKSDHNPKRPHAVAGGKGSRSGIAAAGVLAGVAAGAAVISIAGETDEDDRSHSDSDSDATDGDASNDIIGTSSEGSDDEEPPEHEQSDDSENSSADETPDDDEESQNENASDVDEDQDDETLDTDSDDGDGPDQADESDSGASSDEENDAEASMGVDSSEGEDADEDSSGDEGQAEDTQSESENSGDESEDNDDDATNQDSSEQEDNSDEDSAESSSDSGNDESEQGTDDEEEDEQDRSSDGDNSDDSEHDDGNDSDEFEASDED